jgi:hypothetical protein
VEREVPLNQGASDCSREAAERRSLEHQPFGFGGAQRFTADVYRVSKSSRVERRNEARLEESGSLPAPIQVTNARSLQRCTRLKHSTVFFSTMFRSAELPTHGTIFAGSKQAAIEAGSEVQNLHRMQ